MWQRQHVQELLSTGQITSLARLSLSSGFCYSWQQDPSGRSRDCPDHVLAVGMNLCLPFQWHLISGLSAARRADEVIATSGDDLAARVQDITKGKLAYAAVDPIAGDFTKDVTAAVRPGGTVYVSVLTR